MSTSDFEYEKWIADLKTRYQSSQIKAAVKVNSELIKFYWSLGKDIVVQKAESKWGSGFYKKLSSDLTSSIPNVKGFSETNLKYMKHFFELFKNETMIRPQLVDELTLIPWGHIRYIIDYSKSNSKKALFFIQDTLPALQGDLAQQLTKDLLKNENDNPTIGLLICKSKDDVVAQYSIESSAVPISISEYELKNLYPADFKCSLPSIEEIEKELSCLE